MIPIKQLSKRAKLIYDDINSAKIFYKNAEDKEIFIDGVIKKKTISDNIVKIFISFSSDTDVNITRVEIYDTQGDVFYVSDVDIIKDSRYKFLLVCEIRLINEVVK